MEMMASDRVCYVHCNFCNTILAVSVPCNNMFTIVTVRCGHCTNLLSVNMATSLVPSSSQDHNQYTQKQQVSITSTDHDDRDSIYKEMSGSSSKCNKLGSGLDQYVEHDQQQPRTPPIPPPEKRQRVPSAYNRFIKEEIQRIKARNPEISHREAFSTAAKNWAHFPHIHFGLKLADGNQQPT